MCRGVEENNNQGGFSEIPNIPKEAALHPRQLRRPNASTVTCAVISCELCSSRATLYCQADDAYLCRKCDQWVHGANFLARRHVRCFLCNTCQKLTQRYLIGVSTEVVLPTLVSNSSERSQCQTFETTNCSTKLKWPFLLL
ncbi:hypothetical protein TIFTF001_027200 [Ficus carica]|uniref:B box-type domain-containing protein n=1 Tax=Ficus carica TaxID=3494 RepID=A0AA88DMM9_FICCA|nr:hypothetical protein TIFTF001_027200 [Ficus carica]